MDAELQAFAERLDRCTTPEDLFGVLSGTADAMLTAAKTLYHRFARIAHEDRYTSADDKRRAAAAFRRLGALWDEAQTRLAQGIYGRPVATKPATIKTRRTTYTIQRGIASGDFATLYYATTTDGHERVVKIAKSAAANPFLENEARVLKALRDGARNTKMAAYFPELVESFTTTGTDRRVNVFTFRAGFYPLTAIERDYPQGVDPRHFVWIFNRLLTVLGFAHFQTFVHGAVLPANILIHPDDHGLMLVGWTFSVTRGEALRAVSAGWQQAYPPEVTAKRGATSATDIYLAARSMGYVLSGDRAVPPHLPRTVPVGFKRFLDSCLLAAQSRRPQEAFELYDAFGKVASAIYGPRRFIKLELTAAAL